MGIRRTYCCACPAASPGTRLPLRRLEGTVVSFIALACRPSLSPSPFHSKLSCSLQNSRYAGSSMRLPSFFSREVLGIETTLARRFMGDCEELRERQIWASKPSIWRRPLRMRTGEEEVMLSKERERRASMAAGWGKERTRDRVSSEAEREES